MKQIKKKNEKGFTMIELIIVVAIMAIIGAVLVPTFGKMSAKARLTSDITTIKTLQRQLDIYNAENGKYPTGIATSPLASTVLLDLANGGYIDAKDLSGTTPAFGLKLQTSGSVLVVDNKCKLKVTDTAYGNLIDEINASANGGNKGWVEK